MTVQGVFVIAALSFAVQASLRTSAMSQDLIRQMEQQKHTDRTAEEAQKDATKALALAGSTEANIQWIRSSIEAIRQDMRRKEP